MFVEVIPALRLPPKFSVFDYLLSAGFTPSPGDVIRVPFRSGLILGIVRRVKPTTEMTGPLKTIAGEASGVNIDLPTLEWAARSYGAPLPLLAFSLLPAAPRRQDDFLFAETATVPIVPETDLHKPNQQTISIYRTPNERLAVHIEIIQKTIRNGRQVLILSPEEADLEFLAAGLRPLAPDLVTLSGAQGILEAWRSMLSFGRGTAPVLIGTRLAALTPARNLGAIIIDRDQDPSHKQSGANPRYDAREIAEKRAAGGLPLTILTETPRLSVINRYPNAPLPSGAAPLIINLKNEWRGGNSGLLSRQLIEALAGTRQDGKVSLLLHNRKGLGGLVICNDCREPAVCTACKLPLAAERSGLICRVCGSVRDLPLFCKKCSGARIVIKKLGIERLAQDLQKNIRGITVAEIARQKEGVAAPPLPAADVLLGTEVMLHWYRNKLFDSPIGLAGVALADHLWQKPEYPANEEALAVLVSLRNIAEAARAPFLIQTLDPEHRTIQALTRRVGDFYRQELDDRKRLGYPPAGVLIKLTSAALRPDDAGTRQLTARLEEVGARVNVTSQPGRRDRNLTLVTARLPDDEALRLHAVAAAGSDWTIDVNPRYIFT